ncbi:MAG: PQQ-binding-like beta-propeller repeat protein [Gammaproteobacteria bacterium]|jgi:outer membrane protein assembly factor BamB|nr:PQQ-binding-like beta-propeller repeat protein [Gammaproteobacteria bacterium]MBT3723123.1 PQQ-binding-like beta-propeller repeat protein [Gammaproteobacteria bacterium]MBT4077218.1 PQQ-binding-like beta-propeller repeat protein [Gammaproteobacteria bacterium]MBT4192718.1 PQQ-binding-like beta-propeller repeat protein [Gammaproteobacteria bacterium]MBT4451727.1 PQQ-binding-like beta-propeller repeat protein [Gammaproteobacteria bacterium]
MNFKFLKKWMVNPVALLTGFTLFFAPGLVKGASDIELIWQAKLESPIHLPPVITAETVIATSSKGVVKGFNRKSGQLNWETEKGIRYWDRSLVVHDDKFFVGLSGGLFQAHSIVDGKLLWQLDLGVDVQSKPLVKHNTLYIPTTYVGPELSNDPHGKAILFAVDLNSGKMKWSTKTGNYALQSPSINDGTLFLAGSYYDPSIDIDEGGPMKISAHNINDGSLLWDFKGVDGYIKAIYADKDAVVYVGYQDFINALNSQNGQQLWRVDTGNWTPSLLGSDGVIYYGSATTKVFAISSQNGIKLWQFNIDGGSFNYLLGKPVLSEGKLLFLTQRGDIYALDSVSGKRSWVKSTQVNARAGLSVEGSTIAMGGIDGTLQLYQIRKDNAYRVSMIDRRL